MGWVGLGTWVLKALGVLGVYLMCVCAPDTQRMTSAFHTYETPFTHQTPCTPDAAVSRLPARVGRPHPRHMAQDPLEGGVQPQRVSAAAADDEEERGWLHQGEGC